MAHATKTPAKPEPKPARVAWTKDDVGTLVKTIVNLENKIKSMQAEIKVLGAKIERK